MRRYDIHTRIDGAVPAEYIQNRVNTCTAFYVKRALHESGLPQEAQLDVIENLIEYVKKHSVEDKAARQKQGES